MEYALKRSARAKYMRLAVYPDGAVVVTAPRFFGISAIEDFVAKHAEWIKAQVQRAKGRTVIYIKRGDIPMLKKKALEYAEAKCREYAALYGFEFAKISVRSQKSRWGSCSQNGNLSFNYKIAALPEHLAEYVVVHEICHLGAFDHSRAFWDLVARVVPDHKERRKEMRSLAFMCS